MATLAEAKQFEQEGQLQQALDIYNQMWAGVPQDGDYYAAFSLFWMRRNRFDHAVQVVNKGIEIDPGHQALPHLMARALTQWNKLEEARTWFDRAMEKQPVPFDFRRNYAAFLKLDRQYDKAFTLYQELLQENAGDAITQLELAKLYVLMGQKWDDIPDMLRQVLDKKPHFFDAWLDLCMFLAEKRDFARIPAALSKVEAMQHFPQPIMEGMRITHLLGNYLKEQKAGADLPAQSLPMIPDLAKAMSILNVFRSMLAALYKENETHPEIFTPEADTSKAFAVGDSHILSMVHLDTPAGPMGGRLVVGCKVFHLASPEHNQFKEGFLRQVSALPEEATIFMSAGEIDCRPNEGFLTYFDKNPDASRQEHIQKIVQDYVAWVKENAGKRKIVFCTVPAPGQSEKETDRVEECATLIKQFNEALKRAADEVLDSYSLTAGENGIADGTHHMDARHLTPRAYHGLFQAYFQ